jgi:hypothetical protein
VPGAVVVRTAVTPESAGICGELGAYPCPHERIERLPGRSLHVALNPADHQLELPAALCCCPDLPR